eukprot:gene32753-41688_t
MSGNSKGKDRARKSSSDRGTPKYAKIKKPLPTSTVKQDQSSPAHVSLCVFNFKGGVGKTTIATNLAAGFALEHIKVGVVDADPQGNLTALFRCNEPQGAEDEEDIISGADSDTMGSEGYSNALENIALGDQRDDDEESTVTVATKPGPASTQKVDLDPPATEDLPPDEEFELNVDSQLGRLLATFNQCNFNPETEFVSPWPTGHADLRMYDCKFRCRFVDPATKAFYFAEPVIKILSGGPDVDASISTFLSQCSGDIARNSGAYLGSFRHLLKRLAEENDLEVILVDVGPSTAILNQFFVMSCDYILPPAFADKSSFDSVKHLLNRVLPEFHEQAELWHKKGKEL